MDIPWNVPLSHGTMGWDGQWDTHASVEGQVDILWNVPLSHWTMGMDNLRRFWTSMLPCLPLMLLNLSLSFYDCGLRLCETLPSFSYFRLPFLNLHLYSSFAFHLKRTPPSLVFSTSFLVYNYSLSTEWDDTLPFQVGRCFTKQLNAMNYS